MTDLPAVTPGREPLSLAEAMKVGQAASRLINLSTANARIDGGAGLSLKTTDGTISFALSRQTTEAVLALLIEREAAFLSSFNVEIGL